MHFWIPRSLWLKLFLTFGFFTALAVTLDYIIAFWWIALPGFLVAGIVTWIWLVPLAVGREDYAKASIPEKVIGTLLVMGQMFVAALLAGYIISWFISQWMALIAAIVFVGIIFGIFALNDWLKSRKRPRPLTSGAPKHRSDQRG